MLQNVFDKLMTRQKMPDKCDFCGLEIEIGTNQYILELMKNDGTTSFNDRIRAQNKIDMCSSCYIERLSKSGYEPKWIREIKNDNWKSGSKKSDERYFIPKEKQTELAQV